MVEQNVLVLGSFEDSDLFRTDLKEALDTLNCSSKFVKDVKELTEHLNPDSLRTLTHCYLEPSLAVAKLGDRFQFEREGYFVLDTREGTPERPVFNRTVTLRDTWAKIAKQSAGQKR